LQIFVGLEREEDRTRTRNIRATLRHARQILSTAVLEMTMNCTGNKTTVQFYMLLIKPSSYFNPLIHLNRTYHAQRWWTHSIPIYENMKMR